MGASVSQRTSAVCSPAAGVTRALGAKDKAPRTRTVTAAPIETVAA